ncbi:nucleolar RNA-binding Nop10p family protein [Candidatus Woesearchaeota archaeon]|nr:nucleolar RNA-binding Nop10p family protein [Candidatus Woesearchaeota archaeon]
MAEHIHKCLSCNIYTMKKACPSCNGNTIIPRPPKFSLDDKYAGLRRKVKVEELQQKGLY